MAVVAPQWLVGLGVPRCNFEQRLRPPAGPGNDGSRLRGLFAARKLERGELIAAVPRQSVLSADVALNYCRVVGGAPARARAQAMTSDLLRFTDSIARVQATTESSGALGSPHPLTSRSSLLALAVITISRLRSEQSLLDAEVQPEVCRAIDGWLRSWPAAYPSIGAVLQREARREPSLLAGLYDGDVDRVLTRDGSPRRAALRRRDYDGRIERIAKQDAELEASVLLPFVKVLIKHPNIWSAGTAGSNGEKEVEARLLSTVRWAHFMLRSRAAQLDGTVSIAPVVDMINHSTRLCNTAYFASAEGETIGGRGGGSIAIVATKPVAAGDELLMDYGNVAQRGFLFGYDSTTLQQKSTERRVLETDEELRTNVVQSTVSPEMEAARLRISKDHASWVWTFGFLKEEDDRTYEASLRWSSSIAARVSNMTNRRFNGRPGEFCTGVPEGLEYLRKSRARLLDHYQGKIVFPTSAEDRQQLAAAPAAELPPKS